MRAHSFLEHTFKVQVPTFAFELVEQAFKDAKDAGVPDHAEIALEDGVYRHIHFTWSDEFTWEENGT